MGVKLFDRSTHPVSLTEVGLWFRPVAEDLLRRALAARQSAQAISDDTMATLHFSATHVLSWTFFPNWLHGFGERLANIGALRLVSDTLSACEGLMLQERVQFLLCHYHPKVGNRLDSETFESLRIGDDVLVPVAAQGVISATAKRRESVPILSYSDESGLGQILRALREGEARDAKSPSLFTSHLAIVLKAMAIEGRGVAWLPQSLIVEELRDGRLVQAGQHYETIPLEIRLFRRRANGPAGVESFWRLLTKE